jgi:hypothetical protein
MRRKTKKPSLGKRKEDIKRQKENVIRERKRDGVKER